MRVLKFGGSSVGTPDRIQNIIEIIRKAQETSAIAVVVSAFQGVTDQLIAIGREASKGDESYSQHFEEITKRHRDAVRDLVSQKKQGAILGVISTQLMELEDVLHGVFLVKELSQRTLDFIMSFGEILSASIIAEAVRERGVEAEFLDARSIVRTDDHFGEARVDFEVTNARIRDHFEKHPALQIVTGFIGSTANHETTTLGRGGSDYTASILGAALNASEIDLWTDVDGVMTADPRKVKTAFTIEGMTYEEAMEMSHFGAKIIHPPTMQPARSLKIPLRILNTFHSDFGGTRIGEDKHTGEFIITGISSISHVALLTIQGSGMIGIAGISNRLFGALARRSISVILITQASSEHSICIAVAPEAAEVARRVIEEEFALEMIAGRIDEVGLETDLSILAVVGENMRHTPGISARLFQALGSHRVNVVAIAQGSSERNISVVIYQRDEEKALNAVHNAFFMPALKVVSVFVAGTGLIGNALLEQIRNYRETLIKRDALDLRVAGILNTRTMALEEKGIALDQWKERLAGKPSSDQWIAAAKTAPHAIFVDCTNSDAMAPMYETLLKSGVAVVTANKKPLAGATADYCKIMRASAGAGSLIYATTVGAGLPIIGSLQDLVRSGDQIKRIEAILSGTLSYLFCAFGSKDSPSFSELVREAQRKGFTEPDPRDDLSGADVARKLLILARETGLTLEPKDVVVENLVPENCRAVKMGEFFFAALSKEDESFAARRDGAARRGHVLRHVAQLEDGKARVSLQEIGPEHPFFNAAGGETIVSITTRRYASPLVIRGGGAGAEITAASLLAGIIRAGVNRK